MNAELRAKHMETLTDPAAIYLYDTLCAACEAREGGMSDADQALVGDIADMEQTKQLFKRDIKERGIGQERNNGRQKYWQENKCVPQLRAFMEQQRKHMAELRITAAGRKAATVPIDDGFDDI